MWCKSFIVSLFFLRNYASAYPRMCVRVSFQDEDAANVK